MDVYIYLIVVVLVDLFCVVVVAEGVSEDVLDLSIKYNIH